MSVNDYFWQCARTPHRCRYVYNIVPANITLFSIPKNPFLPSFVLPSTHANRQIEVWRRRKNKTNALLLLLYRVGGRQNRWVYTCYYTSFHPRRVGWPVPMQYGHTVRLFLSFDPKTCFFFFAPIFYIIIYDVRGTGHMII